ncbi:MAG: Dabb family protein [Myxococcota bacterium]
MRSEDMGARSSKAPAFNDRNSGLAASLMMEPAGARLDRTPTEPMPSTEHYGAREQRASEVIWRVAMTVIHNVLFKLEDPAQAEAAAERLRAMKGRIDVLRSIEVGIDQLGTARSYHVALITRFDSWEDLETYRNHPEHQPVLAFLGSLSEHAAVVDFEL